MVFAFVETWFSALALAAGAVSIPVIIHLLNRRRFKVVTWAAMRFLLAAQKKNSRRMRLEQILLLALRCLLVLLLVLAMASLSGWAEAMWRWFAPDGGQRFIAGGRRTHKILVVDGSLSMALKRDDGTCFDRARALAAQLVRESPGGDGFSVVLMAAPPRRVVPEPSEDARKVVAEIDHLKQTHGNADLAATLSTVESLVRASPGKYPAREVYFLTDMQQSTWVARQPAALSATLQKIRERAQTVFVDVGRDGVANLAVTNLILDDALASTTRKTPVVATLTNYGDTRRDVSVRLFVGKARAAAGDRPFEPHEVEEKIVKQIKRGEAAPVAFAYQFPGPGDYVLLVQTAHDELEPDDLRAAVVTVKNEVPVMLVNGKPAVEAFDRATEWLRMALNPFDEKDRSAPVAARPKVLSQSQFADEGLGDLTRFDSVFLCDVPRFSLAEVRRLESHVRRGGSAVFCLGPNVDTTSYNDLLYRDGKGLLPARLADHEKANARYNFRLAMEPDADREPPLKPFGSEAAREFLAAARFRQFIQAEPAPRAGPRRVLSFVPVAIPGTGKEKAGAPQSSMPRGGPAVLEWRPPAGREPNAGRMRGRVVLITTTVNADWNNWPTSPSFPPLMQEILYHASAARLREQVVHVGEPIELYLPNTATGVEATVSTPDGRTETARTQAQDDAAVVRWPDTDVSGVYSVTVGPEPRQHLFAVNVPSVSDAQQQTESDLARATRDDLLKTYPEWDFQVVTELGQVTHAPPAEGEPERVVVLLGDAVARWLLLAVLALLLAEVVLAWHFGHYSADVTPPEESARPQGRTKAQWALAAAPWLMFAAVLGLAFVLAHDWFTGDFLGFLPEWGRRAVEGVARIDPPAPGESSRWRLEYRPYFLDGRADPWLAAALAAGAAFLVYSLYSREGSPAARARDAGGRLVRLGLRLCLLFVMLAVLLPRDRFWFERQTWPDVVVLIDDSQSMSNVDAYKDTRVKEAVERLSHLEGATGTDRLALAQALVTRGETDWLTALLTRRKVRVHVYHCSARAHRLMEQGVTTPEDVPPALEAINALKAGPENDSSQLGTAVRQVLNDFRGSSLAAVVMLTDGVTIEGEDLVKVSKYAQQMGVPLYFVGIGDAQDVRDLYLSDLTGPDSAYVNDRLIFAVNVTAQGYNNLTVPVVLRDKATGKELARKTVQLDSANKTVKVILTHQPTEPGEKMYELVVPNQEDEATTENNRLQRAVFVHESRQIKVLYVEGYRRWEYHYIKTLLERESARIKGNKSIDLKVLLLDADPDFAAQDRSAISEFPSKAELNAFDVVLLGDVDPQAKFDGKMTEHLKDLADFVRERGGGLLMIAGERHAPSAYKDTPLKDVLPIDVTRDRPDDDAEIAESYRPALTPTGRVHPIFQLSPGDERESDAVWNRLREMYWHADGYQPKRAAEVLAVLPKKGGAGGNGAGLDGHPLVLQQFAGAGRSMFLGFCETWRWNFREDQLYFNRFWIETVRYLARTRLGHVELRLDRQTSYRRGEPIRVTVRFPDDAPPPPADLDVKVTVERRNPARPGDAEVRTVQLAKVEGSRASYEAVLTQTPEGEYKFWLALPSVTPRPRAECKVVRPPGEMERLRMNQADLERAADTSQGRFYTLADADRLLDDLPTGTRVTVNAPGPPYVWWNHLALFVLVLGLLTTEWLLRKQKNLL